MTRSDNPGDGARLLRAAAREIDELHAFFMTWLGGTRPKNPAALDRLEAALAPGFSMVTPDGRRLSRAAVIGWITAAHGARGAEFRIWITDIEPLHLEPPHALIGYVERQHAEGRETARCASVLFRVDPEGPNGLRWLAVHETWLAT